MKSETDVRMQGGSLHKSAVAKKQWIKGQVP